MRECEEIFKIVQGCRDFWLGFVGDSRLESRQLQHMSEACREDEQSRQLEHYKTKSLAWPFC